MVFYLELLEMGNIFSYYVSVLHMNYNEINIYIPILCSKHI